MWCSYCSQSFCFIAKVFPIPGKTMATNQTYDRSRSPNCRPVIYFIRLIKNFFLDLIEFGLDCDLSNCCEKFKWKAEAPGRQNVLQNGNWFPDETKNARNLASMYFIDNFDAIFFFF